MIDQFAVGVDRQRAVEDPVGGDLAALGGELHFAAHEAMVELDGAGARVEAPGVDAAAGFGMQPGSEAGHAFMDDDVVDRPA